MIATTPTDILRFIAERHASQIETVLVTLVGIKGGASRAIGAQMAIDANGQRAGSFSGGCIEDAVAEEALETLSDGWGRVVRYGVGSPYIDVRLPCGGGIDLLFTPRPQSSVISAVLDKLEQREAASVALQCDSITMLPALTQRAWNGECLHHNYQPDLRIYALGQGEDLTAFARLGAYFGANIHALTPDRTAFDLLASDGIAATYLATRTTLPIPQSDPWSAIVFLFHGPDWEEQLLPQALALPSFYVGAIGSRRTHTARLAMLEKAGVPFEKISSIRGHIGLIPATRDPATLALSILGEIVADFNTLSQWSHWMGQSLAGTTIE
ncbi:XdhC family protein [Novosphingobium sp.]|uniref:XdhC family protein n=1 Tax=Novosphingobium sp. TaxID=1874826 RepID=UPI0035627EE5